MSIALWVFRLSPNCYPRPLLLRGQIHLAQEGPEAGVISDILEQRLAVLYVFTYANSLQALTQ